MEEFSSEEFSSEVSSSEEFSSEVSSSEEGSSEVMDSAESSSQVYSETSIPDETLTQISEMHSAVIIGLAMFGSLFFLLVFDIVFKKLSRFF